MTTDTKVDLNNVYSFDADGQSYFSSTPNSELLSQVTVDPTEFQDFYNSSQSLGLEVSLGDARSPLFGGIRSA